MEQKRKLPHAEVIKQLWRRGNLSWLLDSNQKDLYDLYYSGSHKTNVWLLARRSGKSFALSLLAIEQCMRVPNSIVKILSPTKTQVNVNLRPIFKKILLTCPEELKPNLKEKDLIYFFPNGSEIHLAGSDNGHAEKLRGGDSHIVIIDEAGSVGGLDNILKEILIPTTLTTKGKVIIAGTPPKDPDHDMISYIERAELSGALVRRTIRDNPRLTQEMIDELSDELGGLEFEAARRELFCEIIKSTDRSVIPEATDAVLKECTQIWKRPLFFDSYVSMDLGLTDLTVVLFGYYDFMADKVIIEKEIVKNSQNLHLKKLAEEIQKTEELLWVAPGTNEVMRPYKRVSDTNLVATNEIALSTDKVIVFKSAAKDDNASAINFLRTLIGTKKIIIDPSCTTLIRHLTNVKWRSDNDRTKFARSPDDGHYDAVDALKYMVRSINFKKNPYPANSRVSIENMHIGGNVEHKFGQVNIPNQVYKKLFGRK